MKLKQFIQNPEIILRLFLGIVFLSAAMYRIFFFTAGINEMISLDLPSWFTILVIIFEIICSIFLFLNLKIKLISLLLIIFLSTAILIAIIENFYSIINSLGELFVFKAQPVDIVLHICFILMLIILYFKSNKKNIKN